MSLEDSSVYELGTKHIPESWEELFAESRDLLWTVDKSIKNIGDHYSPKKENIFAAFKRTKLQDVKVVIIGQDPYPGYCDKVLDYRAIGLSFSQHPEEKIAPSLRNIYKELKENYPDFPDQPNGDLGHWADQGIFLINSCLTYNLDGSGGDHSKRKIWMSFIVKTLKYIYSKNKNTIFVCWGSKAQEIFNLTGLKNANRLFSGHPSPLAANNKFATGTKFSGCGHFKEINRLLNSFGVKEIEWGNRNLNGGNKLKIEDIGESEELNNLFNNFSINPETTLKKEDSSDEEFGNI